jgi:hypothetical protein
MNHFQAVRVAALLAVIFAAGVLTGRFTAPKPEVIYSGGRGDGKLSEVAVRRMTRQIGLTPEEQEKVRKVFEEMEVQVDRHPFMSQERMTVFRDFVPKIKAQLPPEKHTAVDRYARDVQRRYEAAQRQRARNNQ